MNNQEKLNKLSEIFKHISSTVGHDLFSKDELEDFNKLSYEEDVIENSSESSDDDGEDVEL